MPHLQIHLDPCPCESGYVIEHCCRKPAGNLLSGAKLTSTSHEQCYANALGNCSTEISREHWISENILWTNEPAGTVTLGGLPWMPEGAKKTISIASMQCKMLCTSHNTALSPLDTVGGRLFEAFPGVNIRKKPNQRIHLFVGPDLERWMVKMLCGAVCSTAVRNKEETSIGWKPPASWLDFVFHGTSLPFPAGFYLCQNVGDKFQAAKPLEIACLSSEGEIYGIDLHFHGFHFLLTMDPPRIPFADDSLLVNAIHRPSTLIIRENDSETVLLFYWGPNYKGAEITSEFHRA